MPRKTTAAGRRLSKADDATIPLPPDNGLDELSIASKADEDKKPWETDDEDKSKDTASKADDDEDEDDEDDEDDDASKADCDEDEKMGKSRSFSADLRKAVKLLARHGELHDPALRKEILITQELKGDGLNKSQRAELISLLGGHVRPGSADRVAQAQMPGSAMRKSMVDNSAMAEGYDNITKSLVAQAQHLDGVCRQIGETNHLMARVLTKSAQTVSEIYDRQEQLAEAFESLSHQPAHGPRSAGLGWTEKSFAGEAKRGVPGAKGGRLEKSSRSDVVNALDSLAKSARPGSETHNACRMAKSSLLLGRPLMPSMYAKLEQHLASQDS